MKQYTLEELAEEYADTLAQPPNGWGQHVSRRFGCISHDLMGMAQRTYSTEAVDKAFTKAVKDKGI